MTEDEIKLKLEKLREAEAKQAEKVEGIGKSLEATKKRFNKENEKLNTIRIEIQRFDGYLLRKVAEEYGFDNYDMLRAFLAENTSKRKSYEKEQV